MKPTYRAAAIKNLEDDCPRPDLWAVIEERDGTYFETHAMFATYMEAEIRATSLNLNRHEATMNVAY
jgi:hypothetical protein